uniref:Uncharacterized protein n=1 Tax=Romanomermis culicivorax TaxID=13658 RepID=A0A915ITE5_ROMCU
MSTLSYLKDKEVYGMFVLMYLNPNSTKSLRLSAACVHVMAIIFASLTSRYSVRSRPDLNNSNARNSSNSLKIRVKWRQHPMDISKSLSKLKRAPDQKKIESFNRLH